MAESGIPRASGRLPALKRRGRIFTDPMKRAPIASLVVALTVLAPVAVSVAVAAAPAKALPRSTPEAQGISSAAILGFVEEADRSIESLHSLMIVRHGQVVAEGWWTPYDASTRHELYSLSKSFTSTAVGFAVAEGKLSVDDEVLKFFPEDAPANPSGNLKAMRVSDLLRMQAGHEREITITREALSTRAFLAHPVPFKPGTRFLYNTPATFMQSAIVQKVSGQPVLEYLKPRLFEPLGIEDPTWDTNAQGISLGGYGLSVKTEDIAKFGQLYLQKGRWQGRQLLPASWVEAATSRQTSNGSNPRSDWDQGYGYQFWRCQNNAYRGDGAFGQYCIVMPEQDAVIAMTSGVRDMQSILNLVWSRLLPAMQPKRLPSDAATQARLKSVLGALKLKTVEGAQSSPMASRVVGRRYAIAANDHQLESLTVMKSGPEGATLNLRFHGVDRTVVCGAGRWVKGRLEFGQFPERIVGASSAWVQEDTLVAKLCFPETPYTLSLKMKFSGNDLVLDPEFNVSIFPTHLARWTGKAE